MLTSAPIPRWRARGRRWLAMVPGRVSDRRDSTEFGESFPVPDTGELGAGVGMGHQPFEAGTAGPADPASPPHPFDLKGFHQTSDLVPADVITSTPRRLPQFVGPIQLPVCHPQRHRIGMITASRIARADGTRFLAA